MNSVLTVTRASLPGSFIAVITISGRLDAATVNQLDRAFTEAQAARNRVFIIDMSGLHYVSSSGLRVLLTGRNNARRRGGDVLLCGLTSSVREVFDMVGFTGVFNIYASFEQAQEAATGPTKG